MTVAPSTPEKKAACTASTRLGGSSLNWVLFGTIIATVIYFFGFVDLFMYKTESVFLWAGRAWNPEMNQEHSWLVPPIAMFLMWHHRKRFWGLAGKGSNLGLIFVGLGVFLYIFSARCLQPRYGLLAVPFLIFGGVFYLWGGKSARVILFPCVFLLFMIPLGALEQTTNELQLVVSRVMPGLCNIIGIRIQADGNTLRALDGSFNFEIAEGCSGIRSLFALTMLTALFVHLTQKQIWKKLVIFGMSIVFAIIGNVGRIFTIILVAKFIDPELASGLYHDYSGFIFFPIALGAMILFSKLLNIATGDAPVRNSKEAEVIVYDH